MVWSLADRLGSVDLLTDASGVVVEKRTYDSFGNLLTTTTPNSQQLTPNFRYGYTGRERDSESGLEYYRARYYDPQVGRFISVDPAGFGAGDTNLYRYVGNSSTMATDPTGMWSLQEAWNSGVSSVQQGWNNLTHGAQQNFNNTVQTAQDFAYDQLVTVDRVVAGLAGFATGGYTDWIREGYGDKIAGQKDSFEYALGQSLGFGITTVLGALAPPALGVKVGVAGRVAQGYLISQTFKGAYDTTTKIKDGQMDWSNPWSYVETVGSFAPVLGAGARQLGKIGVVENAIAKATAVGENVWNSASQKASDSLRKWITIQAEGRANVWTSETGAINLSEANDLVRRDRTMYSREGTINRKGEQTYKSYIDENTGDLYPANADGSATIATHVRGQAKVGVGTKSDSSYTSFSEGSHESTFFGENKIRLDLNRLKADIKSREVRRIVVIDHPTMTKIFERRLELAQRKLEAGKILKDDFNLIKRDLDNVYKHKEVLIKGIVPSKYLNTGG
jgi:RHS repeat-associated protein